jgi:peptidoglycan/LPS O-acetylase OafA/YrhL
MPPPDMLDRPQVKGLRSLVELCVPLLLFEAVAIAALGAIALVKGYRRHRSWRVLALMAVGLAFIFGGAFWGDHLPSHGVEVLVTLIGSGFMIAAHRTNHTFCRDCGCRHSD